MSYARLRPGESDAPVANRRAANAPARAVRNTDANPAGERVGSEVLPGGSAKQHWSIAEVDMAAPGQRKAAGPAPMDAPPLVQQVLHSSGHPDNPYIDKGPAHGHTGMDELLHSWEYGERLQQLTREARNRLGG